jgi:hypothetical protein
VQLGASLAGRLGVVELCSWEPASLAVSAWSNVVRNNS